MFAAAANSDERHLGFDLLAECAAEAALSCLAIAWRMLLSPRVRPLQPVFRVEEIAAKAIAEFLCVFALGEAKHGHVHIVVTIGVVARAQRQSRRVAEEMDRQEIVAQAARVRKVETKIARQDPRPLARITISADGRTVVAVDDAQPALFLIDAEASRVRDEVVLKDVPKAAQIARYAPDNSLIGVTSLNSDTVSLVDPSFREQTAIKVGSQPMDMAFRGDELFVACQGDGSVHIIDIPKRRAKTSFRAGAGCESLGFF